ncbi:hypothetical protein MsAg5_04760 [Methanosarcinaceae archaeon Ag5]|uniref:DUF112 domain-containing protein n=1 Tax=Methanolapillus africanus TaxID=3028297 RepID=A0AAE4MK52_9EURY|nr:hypothetical protein [Methanosarcinaceae archaeon Ag5]
MVYIRAPFFWIMISGAFPDLFSSFSPIFGLLLCMIFGWIFGFFSGLVPGIHTNNFAILLASAAPVLYVFGLSPIAVCVIILSCAVSHTFHNIIPAIFLGAPGEDTALLVLPGHRLLLDGKGPAAVRLSAMGSAGAVLSSLIVMIPITFFFYIAYPHLQPYMGFVLLLVTALMIFSENGFQKRIAAIFVFLAAGFLGVIAFHFEDMDMMASPLSILSNSGASVLMPLLSGLFGASQMIVSFLTESAIPETKKSVETFPQNKFVKSVLSGTVTGALVAWIPGVSSSVAAILSGFFIGNGNRNEETELETDLEIMLEPDTEIETELQAETEIETEWETEIETEWETELKTESETELETEIETKTEAETVSQDLGFFEKNAYIDAKEEDENNAKEFIVTISAINTANAIFGLLAFFIIGKTRSGAVVSMSQILNAAGISMNEKVFEAGNLELFFLFYITIIIAGFLSYFSTIRAGNAATDVLRKIDYKKASAAVIVLLSVLVVLFTGFYGAVVFMAATLIGFLPIVLKVKKSNLMGVILFPVMLYFFGLR